MKHAIVVVSSLLLFACPPNQVPDGGAGGGTAGGAGGGTAGGSGGGSGGGTAGGAGPLHTYNGSAAVGDFLTITIDRDAGTIDWVNHSVGTSGTAAFTLGSDGALLIADANAELVKAYEIPGYALLAQDRKAKDGTQKALVFGFQKQVTHKSDFANLTLNLLQFRTLEGGMEVGCGTVAADSTFTGGTYQPYDPYEPAPQLPPYSNGGSIPGTVWSENADAGVLQGIIKSGEPISTLFLTSAGFFGLDAAGGSVFMMSSAASPAFNPTAAGTYALLGFEKVGEATIATGPADAWYGTASFLEDTVTISDAGVFTFASGPSGVLSPFKGSAFQGTGKVVGDCNGLFTMNLPLQGDVFVGFLGDTLVFNSFKKLTDAAGATPATYRYSYGVALRRQ